MKHREIEPKKFVPELSHIHAGLIAVQKPFLDRLADIGNGRVGLCFLAAYAVCEGLAESVKPYSGSVQRMSIYFNKIYVGGLRDRELFGFHGILELKKGEHSFGFIDPTYGQVDDVFRDKFLVFPPDKLGLYYATELQPGDHLRKQVVKKPVGKKDMHDISEEKHEYLAYVQGKWGISKDDYESLVQIVKGAI